MDRRHFLRAGLLSAGGAAALPTIATAASAQAAGTSPYGSLDGIEPDENGVILPAGFTSRIVAVAGEKVGDTDHTWHIFPDGAATFADGEGGWYHTVNSEVFNEGLGGVGAIHYDADGEIVDAYPILRGSRANCSGGPTPWGTWLSCEEVFNGPGKVWECDPTGENEAIPRPAMGLFSHEAVAVDPVSETLYMTEDDFTAGVLYRFTPTTYPDLSEGTLEAAIVADDGSVTWGLVEDPAGDPVRTNAQVEGATQFIGGEGIWYHDGWIYFTTKSDNKVHAVDLRSQRYETIYEANPDDVEAGTAVLSGVDNITVDAGTGDLFVAEDGGNMEVVIITPEGEVAPFLRIVGHDNSELTGPTFNPRRDRFYISSQRAPSPKTIGEIVPELDNGDRLGGMTIEISGPFRGVAAPPETTTTTEAPDEPDTTEAPTTTTTIQSPTTTLAQAGTGDDDDDGGNGAVIGIGAGVAAAAVAGGAFVALRNRRAGDAGTGAETEAEADDTPT